MKRRVDELEDRAPSPRKKLSSNDGLIAQLCKLQEELQESKDQYRDLERNLQQFKTLEKKLIDKDDAISKQLAQIRDLEEQVKTSSMASDSALADAETETTALKSELQKLQDSIVDVDTLRGQLEATQRELAVLREKEVSEGIAAATKLEEEQVSKTDAAMADAAQAANAQIAALTAEF